MDAKIIKTEKTFDTKSLWGTNSATLNRAYVEKTIDHCNELLRVRGYLFLNEVYEHLGLPATRAGQIGGWVVDDLKPDDVMCTIVTDQTVESSVRISFEHQENILHALTDDKES